MELKQGKPIRLQCLRRCLLIVPYGIETKYMEKMFFRFVLLIVPYGIETESALPVFSL